MTVAEPLLVVVLLAAATVGILASRHQHYIKVKRRWPILAEKFGLRFIADGFHLRFARLEGSYREHDISVQRKAPLVRFPTGNRSSRVRDRLIYNISLDARWSPVTIQNLGVLQFAGEALSKNKQDRFQLGEQYFDETLVIEGQISPQMDAVLRRDDVVKSLMALHDLGEKLVVEDGNLKIRKIERPKIEGMAKTINEICDHVELLNRAIGEATSNLGDSTEQTQRRSSSVEKKQAVSHPEDSSNVAW